jgi:hypothetical protein
LILQGKGGFQHALEVRIAYTHFMHMVERVPDVVDARAALPDALCDEAGAAMQVELAHIGRMRRVGDEGERLHAAAIP